MVSKSKLMVRVLYGFPTLLLKKELDLMVSKVLTFLKCKDRQIYSINWNFLRSTVTTL